MSSFSVRVERVVSVEPHPNADRLDLIQVLDWRCVAQKGSFKVGDLCVYFPIDAILPENVESAIFGPDAKVKLSKSRVKTIKLRGAVSQGLAVSPHTLESLVVEKSEWHPKEGDDLTEKLGVTKYEPPVSEVPIAMRGSQNSRSTNPNFRKYTDLDNAKNYPEVFQPGEPVVVTEKIHGTNFRAGYVLTEVNTLWKRVLRFFGQLPKYEFVYGSHNVQLQGKGRKHKTWLQNHGAVPASMNVYEEAVVNYRLRHRIPPGVVLYGEICGDGIQKNYTYGCGKGQRRLVIFDAMKDGQYLSHFKFKDLMRELGLPTVPYLYQGGYEVDDIKALTRGDSVLAPEQKVREGVVVKPISETTHPLIGRKVLKFISDDYLLLKGNSDFH